MNDEEIWLPVESTDGYLEVSNLGRVKRLPRNYTYVDGRIGHLPGGILNGTISAQGYRITGYGKKRIGVHRLVAEAFLPNPEEKLARQTVNHKNGIKLDNRATNLEWASFKKNNEHARDNGLNNQHGENTNLSKFSDQLVQAMKNVHALAVLSDSELAICFGMSQRTVYDIVNGKSRKNG